MTTKQKALEVNHSGGECGEAAADEGRRHQLSSCNVDLRTLISGALCSVASDSHICGPENELVSTRKIMTRQILKNLSH